MPDTNEVHPALIYDWDTFDNEEIKEFLEDELGDEMCDYPKYKPFAIIAMPDISDNLYNTDSFFENTNYVVAYLMINPKNNNIFRSGWGEVDLKVESLNIRLKN